jgi:hypothetical protein
MFELRVFDCYPLLDDLAVSLLPGNLLNVVNLRYRLFWLLLLFELLVLLFNGCLLFELGQLVLNLVFREWKSANEIKQRQNVFSYEI